jgi:hypothetical protein
MRHPTSSCNPVASQRRDLTSEMLGPQRTIVLSVVVLIAIIGLIMFLYLTRPRPISVLETLKSSPRVHIYPGAPGNGGGFSPLVYMYKSSNPQSHAAMLALLRSSQDSHATVPRVKPDCTAIVYSPGGPPIKSTIFGYVSSTGEIGRGKDWCVVPAKFKAWMLVLYKNRKPEGPLHVSGPYGLGPVVVTGRQDSETPGPLKNPRKPKSPPIERPK